MWLLEKLTKELFQNSIEYAVNIDFSNSLIFVICLIAILIWILSAVYHIIKGVYMVSLKQDETTNIIMS